MKTINYLKSDTCYKDYKEAFPDDTNFQNEKLLNAQNSIKEMSISAEEATWCIFNDKRVTSGRKTPYEVAKTILENRKKRLSYYNPKDPSQVTMTKSLILPIIIIVAGIASLVGGIISAVKAIKRYKDMKEQEKGWENE